MKQKYKHLALVPARGGSTGIRDKNLQRIGELSLVKLAWSYCLEAGFFDYTCLSTDSKKISQEIFPQFDLDSTAPHTLSFISEKMVVHHRHETLSSSSSSVYDLISEISKLKEKNLLSMQESASKHDLTLLQQDMNAVGGLLQKNGKSYTQG